MKNKLIRRGAALLLSIVMTLTSMAGLVTVTSAADASSTAYYLSFPNAYDANQVLGANGWGTDAKNFMNGWKMDAMYRTNLHTFGSKNGQICYCIEPGVPRNEGDVFYSKDEKYWKNYPENLNSTLGPDDIKAFIGRILYYGYQGNISESWVSQNPSDADKIAKAYATQILIWETIVGERNAKFGHVDPGSCDSVASIVGAGHPLRTKILAAYNDIAVKVQNHRVLPSFMSSSAGQAVPVELKWDGSAYSATLIDSNNVLPEFSFSSNTNGVTFKVSGNKLTVSTSSVPKEEITITANKSVYRKTVIVWTDNKIGPDGALQDTVTYDANIGDPVSAYLKFQVSFGSAKIVKTSEDGKVSGLQFTISGNGINKTVTTDKNGVFQIDNLGAGTYTVTERAMDEYVPQQSKTVTVVSGKTSTVSFSNMLKKFNVTLIKSDSETGSAQGDATLKGATYGIYKGEELVDKYVTDENGRFTTEYYACGDDWSIREISPSEGYLLDSEIHYVGAEAKNYALEKNSAPDIYSLEENVSGRISVIKHADNGDTKIETPEEGAAFEVYLKSSGSYDDAAESERDLILCDENGYAETKDLPYGTYTVHQIKGNDGCEFMNDFDVVVHADGEVYRYLVNNAAFESYLKVVKTDAETGKTIPYEGAGFRIYDPEGNLITMTLTYPSITVIDTFYTGEDGMLVTPEPLPFGSGYMLEEVFAPYGYVRSKEPVSFNVTEAASEKDTAVTVTEVRFGNVSQKGRISISKSGEVYASVNENKGNYSPVYEVRGLEGAKYEISALNDVYTPDGTLRYPAGTVVDTVITGKDGKGESKLLYLGEYEIKETKAPYGTVLNTETKYASLAYAGQETEITEAAVSFVNERQKVEIEVYKEMEKDPVFGIGDNGEIAEVSFGLYADEDIIAADGKFIPKDGLLEIINVTSDGTAVTSADIPFGKYYLKEIATNEKYLISDDKYPVEFDYAGQDTGKVHIDLNSGENIVNEIIYGNVYGIKKGENGEGLECALMGLYLKGSNSPVMTAVSAADGGFAFSKVPYGEYVVREIEAPEGYVLSDAYYPVVISVDGAFVEIEVYDRLIRGKVILTKVDEEYPDNHLTGAEFEVYSGGVSLGKMTEVEEGIYEMKDLAYGEYSLKETKAPEGFYPDTSTYYFSITKDGETVAVENKAGIGFINSAMRGDLRIEKTSEDGVLEGFTFHLEGTDVTGHFFSEDYVTDEKGEIHVEGLRIGDYVISEVSNEANAKYILPDNVTVRVHEGKTVVAKFENKLIPEVPHNPQTGDRSNIPLWTALTLISGAAAVGLFFALRKRNKGDAE